ncbi:MAG: DUF6544 family protein [Elusimicrobiota bacterium]
MKIIAVFLAVILSIVVMGNLSFKSKIKKEVKELFKNSPDTKKEIIKEEDITNLPEPIQRYLRYSRIIGKEKIKAVRLKQKGQIRREGKKWMAIKAEQYYSAGRPGFIWVANMNIVKVRDKYIEGKGNMLIKLLSIFVLGEAKGPEMDEASLMRYFNEMMWFPTEYLSDKIKWETIDKNSAKATYTDGALSCQAALYINEQCQLVNFIAKRYNSDRKKLFKWSTPISEYREVNGLRLPVKGEAIWHLDTGDFCYIKLEVTDIEYNNPEMY